MVHLRIVFQPCDRDCCWILDRGDALDIRFGMIFEVRWDRVSIDPFTHGGVFFCFWGLCFSQLIFCKGTEAWFPYSQS